MATENNNKIGVLLVNLGTPTAPRPAEIRRFLKEFLSDYRIIDLPRWLWLPLLNGVILPIRSRKIASNYQSIWMPEGSPLMHYSEGLCSGIQQHLPALTVRLAMRYGEPAMGSELDSMQRDGIGKILIVPLYPQFSATTTSSVFDAVWDHYRRRPAAPEFRFLNQYYDEPRWVEAIATRIKDHWNRQGRADLLVLSFHGIPKRYTKQGDPYQAQCEASAAAIVNELGLSESDYRLTYQSRVGREEWLQPYTDKTMKQLPGDGIKTVQVVCPGFSADCLETLEEIAVENRNIFIEAGGERLEYIPALNDGEDHARLFAALIQRHISGWD